VVHGEVVATTYVDSVVGQGVVVMAIGVVEHGVVVAIAVVHGVVTTEL
jgi:hypothetical protein